MSDQLEPELERVARMLAEVGPLPDAPAALRERVLVVPDGGPVSAADHAAAARRPTPRRLRARALLGIAAIAAAIAVVPTGLALDDSTARDIELVARDFAPDGGGTAHVVARGDGSATISLRVWKMPEPGAGKTYEAWLGSSGYRRALGTFKTDATGGATVSWRVPEGKMAGCRWLWVTSEPVGGSDKPSERTALWGPTH